MYYKLKPGVPQVYAIGDKFKLIQGQVVKAAKKPKSSQFKSWLKNGVILPATEEEYLKVNDPEAYEKFMKASKEPTPISELTEAELKAMTKDELIEELELNLDKFTEGEDEVLANFKNLKKAEMVDFLLGIE